MQVLQHPMSNFRTKLLKLRNMSREQTGGNIPINPQLTFIATVVVATLSKVYLVMEYSERG